MPFLPAISIQRKLRVMTLIVTGFALLLTCGIIVWFGILRFKDQTQQELTTLADLIGYSIAPLLEFEEIAAGGNTQQVMDSLVANPNIICGSLYGKADKQLALYVAASRKALPPEHPAAPRFYPENLSLVKLITGSKGENLGTIFLQSDLGTQKRFLWAWIPVIVGALVFAWVVAFLFAARLQKVITEPILQLLQTTRKVSAERDYSVRAPRFAEDELGQLVDGFNAMLEQIQTRNEELQKHRHHLEEEVAERTLELTHVNRDLIAAKEKAEEARQSAEQANQAKSKFLAAMSHELRTPLTAIIGFSEMLCTEIEEDGRTSSLEDLRRIHSSGQHLLGLINGILDLSKIEAGKMELHLEDFDVGSLIREVAGAFQPLIEKKDNALSIEVADPIGSMQTDMVKLRQCLLNLLSNANKFTERGTITLSVNRTTRAGIDWMIFGVRDTGIGMTEAQRQQLFQAFAQADSSIARKYGGTGLGLALTKQFCEMLGGNIQVESSVGCGSTFTLELPCSLPKCRPQAVSSSLVPSARPEAAVRRNGCILVIDDDPAMHKILADALQDQGHQLAFASNGMEGLELARKLRPAVITLDVIMPQMDGWMTLSLLKADPELATVPVVMLTMSPQREFGFAMGVTEYLRKPVERDRLLTVLRQYHLQVSDEILIVEDDPAMREILRRTVEETGHSVSEAENGAVALQVLGERLPSVIILDLMMPVMDGFEFLAELRRHEKWHTIPIVVVSAKDLTDAERAALQGRVQQILQKRSLGREELVREVQETVKLCLSTLATCDI
ncbi:MAG: response regulator [Verrucomicrobiales bacterium]|nr:response regulator [Verrucomicrobiales bacterium]